MTEERKEDEEGAVKGLSVTPAITALLKPTADYLGTELRDYVKATVEEWKAKRRERNLNSHLEGVREKLKAQPPPRSPTGPSFNQLTLFDEWIERAQDIDPEDKELSDIWRNLLAKAARGEAIPTEVIAALKSLSPKEAQFLAHMERRTPALPFVSNSVSAEDRYLARALETRSILERDYAFAVMFLLSTGLSGIFVYYLAQQLNIPITPLAIAGVIATAIMAVGFSLRSGSARWRLTWLGRELIEFVSARHRRPAASDAQPGAQADGPASGGPAA